MDKLEKRIEKLEQHDEEIIITTSWEGEMPDCNDPNVKVIKLRWLDDLSKES